MSYNQLSLDELEVAFGNKVSVEFEGSIHYIRIPKIPLPVGCSPLFTEALLCPVPLDGYASRLFFKERIQSTSTVPGRPNWQQSRVILGQEWHYYSFQGVGQAPFSSMVYNHLRGLLGHC